MKLSYLNITTTDPCYNLAAEQYIFDSLPRDRTYFMLWQNDNAIIIGKYQNTFAEINEAYVKKHGIRVVRRLSGGGAVYHDLGNLNFTFIADANELSTLNFKIFCEPVIRTLAKFGVTAEVNGRNDMTIDGRKFSGNSQYIKQSRIMHHGTILFDSDLSVVSNALLVDESKFQSKASKSVRSRITNVAEHLPCAVSLQEFRNTLLADIAKSAGGEPYTFSDTDLAAIKKLRTERYDTWAWNYGFSPACTIEHRARVEGCGTVDIHIGVSGGLISEMHFYGDFFSVLEPDMLAVRFIGLAPNTQGYAKALENVNVSQYLVGLSRETLMQILCS